MDGIHKKVFSADVLQGNKKAISVLGREDGQGEKNDLKGIPDTKVQGKKTLFIIITV